MLFDRERPLDCTDVEYLKSIIQAGDTIEEIVKSEEKGVDRRRINTNFIKKWVVIEKYRDFMLLEKKTPGGILKTSCTYKELLTTSNFKAGKQLEKRIRERMTNTAERKDCQYYMGKKIVPRCEKIKLMGCRYGTCTHYEKAYVPWA